MVVILTLISLGVLFLLLFPFFLTGNKLLASCSSVNSADKLILLKKEILRCYLDDELAQQRKFLSSRAWEKRRLFLTNRYIDVCRRLDFLVASSKKEEETVS